MYYLSLPLPSFPLSLFLRIYGLKYCPAHALLKHRKYVLCVLPLGDQDNTTRL